MKKEDIKIRVLAGKRPVCGASIEAYPFSVKKYKEIMEKSWTQKVEDRFDFAQVFQEFQKF